MNKIIKIDNKEDMSKFKKKLFLYRSFLCKFTSFEISSKDSSLSPIIEALNIKSRKKRIQYIYNSGVVEIDKYFKGKNYCNFKDGKCLMQRQIKKEKFNGCCRLCQYRTCGACPSRNVACKLFYCSAVKKDNKIIEFNDIDIFKVLSPMQRYILKSDYFSLENEIIMDLYYGPLIAPFRILYRFLRGIIKTKKNK